MAITIGLVSTIGIIIVAISIVVASIALIINNVGDNKPELLYRGDCGANLTVPQIKEMKGKNIKVAPVDGMRFLFSNERVFHVKKNGIHNGKIFDTIRLRVVNGNKEYRYDLTIEGTELIISFRLKTRNNLIKPISNRFLHKAVILSLLNFDNIKFKYLKKANCIVVYKPYFKADAVR